MGVLFPSFALWLLLCVTMAASGSDVVAKIIDSSGPREGGGPEKVIDGDTSSHWNPDIPNEQYHNNWYIIFELEHSYNVTGVDLLNYGDETHDITKFKLESSDDNVNWSLFGKRNVTFGSREWQSFDGFTGAGKFLRFTVTNTFSGYQPWLIELRFIENNQGCGADYESSSGAILHPLRDGVYANNENCSWTISTAVPIKITFVRFDTENRYDYLYVRDGKSMSGTELGNFTGSSVPSPVHLTSTNAYLRFTSDNSQQRNGFELKWEPFGCGGLYTSNNGMIRYPLSGGDYAHNQNCVWIIEAAVPFIITFNRFNVERDFDYLCVRDGGSMSGAILGNFTGSSDPSSVRVTSNTAYLQFISDGSGSRPGFEIKWEPIEMTTHIPTELTNEMSPQMTPSPTGTSSIPIELTTDIPRELTTNIPTGTSTFPIELTTEILRELTTNIPTKMESCPNFETTVHTISTCRGVTEVVENGSGDYNITWSTGSICEGVCEAGYGFFDNPIPKYTCELGVWAPTGRAQECYEIVPVFSAKLQFKITYDRPSIKTLRSHLIERLSAYKNIFCLYTEEEECTIGDPQINSIVDDEGNNLSEVIVTIETPVYNITDESGLTTLMRESLLTLNEEDNKGFMVLVDMERLQWLQPISQNNLKTEPIIVSQECPSGHAYRLGVCVQCPVGHLDC